MRKKWTEKDLSRVAKMRAEGIGWADIGRVMGVSGKSAANTFNKRKK